MLQQIKNIIPEITPGRGGGAGGSIACFQIKCLPVLEHQQHPS